MWMHDGAFAGVCRIPREMALVVGLIIGSQFVNHTYLVLLPPIFTSFRGVRGFYRPARRRTRSTATDEHPFSAFVRPPRGPIRPDAAHGSGRRASSSSRWRHCSSGCRQAGRRGHQGGGTSPRSLHATHRCDAGGCPRSWVLRVQLRRGDRIRHAAGCRHRHHRILPPERAEASACRW